MNKRKERFKNHNYTPASPQTDKKTLKVFLNKERVKKLFCFHNWIYWTFGPATKAHRVCSKCYKKQRNRDIISQYSIWIEENKSSVVMNNYKIK